MNKSEELKLFKYAIGRFSALHSPILGELNIHEPNTYHQNIKKYNRLKSSILLIIDLEIKTTKILSQKHLLLKIKNDLSNNRIRDKYFDKIKPINTKLINLLIQLKNVTTDRNKLILDFGEVYTTRIIENDKIIKQLIENKRLINGLLFSSHSMLDRLEEFKKNKVTKRNKKHRQTTISLLKYLSRMYKKTSPFSSYVATQACQINPLKQNNFIRTNKVSNGYKSRVRINNLIFLYLKEMIFSIDNIKNELPLILNNTIKTEGNQFIFLTNNQNIEKFQYLKSNPIIKLLISQLRTKQEVNKVYTTNNLADFIKPKTDATLSDIKIYIKQLVQVGLFDLYIPISGTDPNWHILLIEYFKELKIGSTKKVINYLKDLESKRAMIEVSEYPRKKILIEEAHQIVMNFMTTSNRTPIPEQIDKTKEDFTLKNKNSTVIESLPLENLSIHITKESLFYEDTSSNIECTVNQTILKPLVSTLNKLIQELYIFDYTDDLKYGLLEQLKSEYSDTVSVNLLKVYKDICTKEIEIKLDSSTNSASNDSINQDIELDQTSISNIRKQWRLGLSKLIKDQIENKARTIHLNSRHFTELNKMIIPKKFKSKKRGETSYGTFCQFYTNDQNDNYLYVENTTLGFGKLYSRFLHLYDEKVKQCVIEENKNIFKDTLLVENTDASHYNANIHEPLLQYEIKSPGSNNMMTINQQIDIVDLKVEFKSEVKLKHIQTNKSVFILDIGFQNHQGRSTLFRLLNKFTLGKRIDTNNVTSNIGFRESCSDSEISAKVIFLPRIIYENAIILKRASWAVRSEDLKLIFQKNSEHESFLKINQFKSAYNMPNEVFVYITRYKHFNTETPLQKEENNVTQSNLTRDDYKPQYINLQNPYFVLLLKKLINKSYNYIIIEEMLPNTNDIIKKNKSNCAEEFIIQWHG